MKSNRTTMITIWSLLALLVVICGSAGTLGLGWLWVRQWVASGTKFPIGEWAQVYVPDGARQSLVYYESDYEVGQQFMRLYMRDAYGER